MNTCVFDQLTTENSKFAEIREDIWVYSNLAASLNENLSVTSVYSYAHINLSENQHETWIVWIKLN